MANTNAKASMTVGKTSPLDVTLLASEATSTAASATTVGIRIGDTTNLTPQLIVRACADAIEKLVEKVGKTGLTGYQQVSGIAAKGKPGLTLNTTTSLATDTHVGAYVNPGTGVSNSSTMILAMSFRACLEKYRESLSSL